MDGPAFIHSAWLLVLVWLWAYRRYFETVADRSPQFEAFCKARPRVTVLVTKSGAETAIAARLNQAIGRRAEVIATLGVWPWPYHALKLSVSKEPGRVLLEVVDCRVLRSRERPLPALTSVLLEAIAPSTDHVVDTWLHPEVYSDGRGRVSRSGWHLTSSASRHPCEARETAPAWSMQTLAAAQAQSDPRQVATAVA